MRLNRRFAPVYATGMLTALLLLPLGQTMAQAMPQDCATVCTCCCQAEVPMEAPSPCCKTPAPAPAPEREGKEGCTGSCPDCACAVISLLPTVMSPEGGQLRPPHPHLFAFAASAPERAAPRTDSPPVPPPQRIHGNLLTSQAASVA